MKTNLVFQTLALVAPLALTTQAKADGTVSLNNYDSGYGIWLVQSGATNPAPAGTMVQVLGGPDANHLSAVTNTAGVDGSTISSGDINALGSGTGSFFDFGFGPVSGVTATSNAVLQVVAWYGTAIGASALWTQATGSDPAPSGSPPPIPTPAILNLPGPVYIFTSGSGPSLPPGLTTPGPTGAGSEGPQGVPSGASYGCELWLEAGVSNNVVVLTLHNVKAGEAYQIWSRTNLWQTDWAHEITNLIATSSLTQTSIALGQRPNLFLRASGTNMLSVVFDGLSAADTRISPPDSMGAVGPNHYVELINKGIAVYDKCGNLVVKTNSDNFFAVGTNAVSAVDPRILYDSQSNRWVACALDLGSSNVILAVSRTSDPSDLAGGWTNRWLSVHQSGLGTDFTTLGLDANGIYVTVLHYDPSVSPGTNAGHTVVAIKKPEIYQDVFVTNVLSVDGIVNGDPIWTLQPAVNFDSVATNGCAWFVTKGAPNLGPPYQGGQLYYRRLQWTGNTVGWVEGNWLVVTNTGANYRDYYDLDGTNGIAFATTGIYAPEAYWQGGTNISLFGAGSRLGMPVLRNGYLWTCHTVGLNGPGGAYSSNDPAGTNVDRSAVQWLKLQVGADGNALTLADHGRVFDGFSAANALWYHFPSLMVNGATNMVMAFSGSGVSNYLSAFYTYRQANGAMPSVPLLLRAGTTAYTFFKWGDYSATTLDPSDDSSFWTVQEYAAPTGKDRPWRTAVGEIKLSH